MTLDTSGPVHVTVAAARPSDDGEHLTKARHESSDLHALEALLGDPSSVSSEEAAPAGFVAEPAARQEAAAAGDGALKPRVAGSPDDAALNLPPPALHAAPEAVRSVDDWSEKHLLLKPEAAGVLTEQGIARPEPTTLDEAGYPTAEENDSTRDGTDIGALLHAPAAGDIDEEDASVADTGTEDTSAEDTSAEDTSILASPCTAEPETAADPHGSERDDGNVGAGVDDSGKAAAAMTADGASFLDDALLRDIAETPSVSSDSISADRVDATGLAVEPPFRDSRPDPDADAARGRGLEPLLYGEPTDPDASEARDTFEEASVQPQATGPEAGPIGSIHLDESPTAPRSTNSAGVEDGAADAEGDLFAHASGPDETEAWTTPVTRERPVERDDPSPEALLPSVSAAPGNGSDPARAGIDEPSVAPASVDAVVAEGAAGTSDASDASGPGVPASAEPGTPFDQSGSERRGAGEVPGSNHPDQTAEASTASGGAFLADALLKDISAAPSVSSDSIPSDQSDATGLTVDSLVGDRGPALGAGAPREEASARTEGPGSDPDPSTGQAEPDELPLPVGRATGSDDGIIGDDGGSIARPADPSSPLPSGTDSGHDESLLRQIADVVAASAGESVETSAPGSLVTGVLATRDAATAPESRDRAEPNSADSMDAVGIAPTGPGTSEAEIDRVGRERPRTRSDLHGQLSPLPESAEPVSGLPDGRRDPGEPADAAAIEDAVERNAETEQSSNPVIHLPDLSGKAPSITCASDGESLLQENTDPVAASSGEPVDATGPGFPENGDAPAPGTAGVQERNESAAPGDMRSEDTGVFARPGSEERVEAGGPPASEDHDAPGDPLEPAPSRNELEASGTKPPKRWSYSDDTAAAAATEDDVSRSAGTEVNAGPVIHLPDRSGTAPSGTEADWGESLLQQNTDPAAASSGEPADVGALRLPGSVDAPAPRAASVREQGEQATPEDEGSEATGAVAPPSSGNEVESVDPLAPEHLDTRSASPAGTPSLHEPAASEVESPVDGTGPDETAATAATEDDVSRNAQTEDGAGPVIGLLDPRGPAPSGTGAVHDESLLRQIADAVAASSGEPAGLRESASPVPVDAQTSEAEVAGSSALDGASAEDAGVVPLPGPGRTEIPADPVEDEGGREEAESAREDDPEAFAAAPGIEFDDTLLLDLADAAPVSSDEDGAPEGLPAAPGRGADPGARPSSVPESAFDVSLPDAGIDPSRVSGAEPDDGYSDAPLEAASPGPAAVLAFATDADTEMALRDGLLGFGSASAGTGEPQVWQGGLRAAIAALAEGRTAPLVIVDIDGVPYPAGAIHELAAVCEVGTVVVAVGSDVSARPGRELLLSGVSDYLAKPLTAEAVRGVASRALAESAGSRPGGRVACFVGCGGSGATTLAVATALHAASRGCYVSVLDLSRSVAAAALALGIEPVAGLDQLLETADKVEVDPESLEGVCGRRMDRIEVYAHRWSPEHPALPSAAAMDRLLAALRQRSQLVLVDGLDEAETRFISSAEFDTRVFVAEPTAGNAPRLARMMDLLDGDRSLVFVQNHTRPFRRDAGARALRELGLGMEPDLTVPFDPAVPETADRGWPQARLPRSVRKPVSALTDRLLDGSSGADAAAAFARAA